MSYNITQSTKQGDEKDTKSMPVTHEFVFVTVWACSDPL